MRTRNRSLKAHARWLVPAALTSALFGCPNQELAPLQPCTVSGVSLEVPQSGVDKVDLLFMIDNSGSMAEEQKKLAAVLPNLVTVLTTGYKAPPTSPDQKPDFPPVKSLHIGVVSSDMGVNGATALGSCGEKSYAPEAPDPGNTPFLDAHPLNRTVLNKPRGDDGVLNTSTAVAVAGISARPPGSPNTTPVSVVVPPDPSCSGIQFPPNQRFIDFNADVSNAADTARQFGCIAKLGKNGCGLEQQLEAILKALTPASSPTTFSGAVGPGMIGMPTRGNGGISGGTMAAGPNANFLRPDAILAIVAVTDEEDCSIPDSSNDLFAPGGNDINVRCGLPQNAGKLHNISERYVKGLRMLKDAAYQDRIIFAGIVGVPLKQQGGKTYTGEQELNNLLGHPDMQFRVNMTGTSLSSMSACSSVDGNADPARRFVELARNFGENGVITSICEDEYGSALNVIIEKIAAQLTGACLPRKLTRNAMGEVECDVVEIKSSNAPSAACNPAKGHIETLPQRNVNGTPRTVCRIQQAPTPNRAPMGNGWYYDDFTQDVMESCQNQPQRIAFTDNANPDPGSQVRFECFQPVAGASDVATGRDAVGYSCVPPAGSSLQGSEICNQRRGDLNLVCVNGTCQIGCENDAQCPDSWVCDRSSGLNFCQNPTCPAAQAAM